MKVLAAAAVALAAIVPAGAAAHAAVPRVQASCTPKAYGKPGNNSFTLHVTSTCGGYRVRSAAECLTFGPPIAYWTYGPFIRRPGISKALCQSSGDTNPVGVEWEVKSGAPINFAFLAPIPGGTNLAEPSRACSPHMYDRKKGYFSFTADFLRDPCHYQLRGAADCLTLIEGVPRHQWGYGPILSKAGKSKASCPLDSTTTIVPWAWEWRPNREHVWNVVLVAPIPPHVHTRTLSP